MLNPSKSKNNPLKKNIISEPEISSQQIDLSDIPDFLHPENENSELYIYLTQRVNWPFYSLQDIYEKQNKDSIGTKKYKVWLNEIVSIELDKKNKIINSAKNYNSKLLIESVRDYMVFLNNYFYKQFEEKIRTFIFLEYFLKKLENDSYIRSSDEFCKLYKLYYYLCRDAENIFDYLEKKEILIKNELYYYEKGQYYERIHKYLEANQTYIEGFINILDETNSQKGKISQNNYINFEKRMTSRIERDLESLNEDWNSIDQYIQKMIKETKENEIKNVNINLNSKKKYFLKEEETNEKFLERKLIKNINIDFSLSEGYLKIKNPEQISKGIEIIGVYGNVKYINNPPDINKVTSITCIYELLKKVLITFFPEWKKEYDNFDLQVKKDKEKLPYSWINKQRPTQTNIKNMNDNNTVLNLVQKEYLNLNTRNDNKEEIVNNNDIIKNENENKENDHEISNMLSNIGLILDKKDSNPINTNNNNNIEHINNIIKPSSIIEKDNKTLIANMQYQMEHPYENKSKNRTKNTNNENNKKIKKKTGIKTNKFKCVGKLNFDQDGLMIINLENDTDKKIDIMQSASKLLLNNDQEKKNNKRYTIVLNNVPRRIKYIKEKTILEKKDFEIRKKEMLQGVNFDYLNSFKKLFETYPQLNNLVDSNQKKISGVYDMYDINLEKNKNLNKNNNLIEETNIQRQNGPSDAMKLLLEVYGIPQNFLEENNPFMEYAKKNGINSNFAFENLFKDMQSYINKKNSKKNNLINKNSKRNNQDKENIDADGDLIIESESDNDSLNEEKNKKKSSKHCVFDSKKNSQIVYLKSEQNENRDEVGKIIDNINKKAEKGIKIGEKTIFSNYKGIREHNTNINNNNNKNLIVNQSIQLSIKKENDNMNKIQDEINKRQMIINNSKISTKVFMSAFNYDLSNKNNNIEGINSKKRSKSKKNRDLIESSIKQQNLSNSLMIDNNFQKNNFMTESNYSKTKRGKLYGSVNNEFRINKEKENQLSNIKESVEREKSSKIDKNENSDEIKIEESDDKNKKNKKGNLGVIGNIRDLDNFDDLFK